MYRGVHICIVVYNFPGIHEDAENTVENENIEEKDGVNENFVKTTDVEDAAKHDIGDTRVEIRLNVENTVTNE